MSRLRTLQGGAFLFIAAWVVHTADHARRGVDATTEAVVWSGTLAGLMAAVSITLILVKHPTAPAIATAVFLGIAVGVSATHLLPDWGVLSDPILVESTTDGWSIVAVVGEIAAALFLGALSLQVTMRNHYAWRISNAHWA